MAGYDIRQAFAEIENELLDSMMRNMKRHRAEEEKEGYEWAQWQAVQLKGLDEYKRKHKKEFGSRFSEINQKIQNAILAARAAGKTAQEQEILKAVRDGAGYRRASDKIAGEFFKVNDRKMDALVKATVHDMEKAEQAVLRMHDDKVRSAIFNAQVYANTGAGTYEKAVDMAVKDYIYAGINCVEYKNGRRVNIKDYADMALRTANKRAYLTGEGEKRKEWGIHTVIMNKRSCPCPLCLPWVGKILVDDVWSGGTEKEAESMGYPLMSHAVASGLYHPNCRDVHTTYFEGISTPPDSKWKQAELDRIKEEYGRQQKGQSAKNQAEKYGRLEKYAMDEEDKKQYKARREEWEKRQGGIDNPTENVILNTDKNVKEETAVHLIGKLDKEIYKCITEDIVTDEVVITDNQIGHIRERHPNDYERFSQYFSEIVSAPDYIIKANKENTAVILKEIVDRGEHFLTVLRLCTSAEPEGYKNSIITFLKIDQKRWNRYLRTKPILYKRE